MSRDARAGSLRRLIINSSRSRADADAASQALAAQTEHYEEHLNKLDRFRAAAHSQSKQSSDIQLWTDEFRYLQRQVGRLGKEVSSHIREVILADPSYSIPNEVMDFLKLQPTEQEVTKQVLDIRDMFRQWKTKATHMPKAKVESNRGVIGEVLDACRASMENHISSLSEEEMRLESEMRETLRWVASWVISLWSTQILL